MALAGCSETEVVPDVPDDTRHSISFNTGDGAEKVTRVDNTVGLQTLGINEIKVYGYKTLTATAQDGTKTTTLQNVMPGYTLRYLDGTANSSTSNTTGWEYVGLTTTDASGSTVPVTDYLGKEQEIKYWDGNSDDYRFFGVLPDNVKKLKYDGQDITSGTTMTPNGKFSMEFSGLTYMTRTATMDANGNVTKYVYHQKRSTSTDSIVSEKDIPMYGTMWQGDPKDNYDKPVVLAFSKPYALVRLVFIRPDGSSVTQLGDTTIAKGDKDYDNKYYSAKFYPKDESKISSDGTVDVEWSMTGTGESTTAKSTDATIPAMKFEPIELTESEKRYQAWPEYVMVPTVGATSTIDYICTVNVKASTTSNGSTTTQVEQRKAYVPKEFTHWKAGYEYTYVFKITYNNSLEFSHVVEVYTKWQAGYVNTTKW